MNDNEKLVLELLSEEPDLTPTGISRRLAMHPYVSKGVCCDLHERGLLEMHETRHDVTGNPVRRYRPAGVPA